MARHVYFAIHYQPDIFRVNQIRNSWVTQGTRESGFFDDSLWEKARKTSPLALKRLIHSGLENTSVTAVLIGTATYSRRWVNYEVIKSFERGNGLLGIRIHRLKNQYGKLSKKGFNPFNYLRFHRPKDGNKTFILQKSGNSVKQYSDISPIANEYLPYQFDGMLNDDFAELFVVYDWVLHDGYHNFSTWVELAALQAGR